MTKPTVIETRKLTKTYNANAAPVTALADISFAAEEGSLRVLGPGSPGVPEGSRLLSRSRCGSCSERGGEIRLRRRWICEG